MLVPPAAGILHPAAGGVFSYQGRMLAITWLHSATTVS